MPLPIDYSLPWYFITRACNGRLLEILSTHRTREEAREACYARVGRRSVRRAPRGPEGQTYEVWSREGMDRSGVLVAALNAGTDAVIEEILRPPPSPPSVYELLMADD